MDVSLPPFPSLKIKGKTLSLNRGWSRQEKLGASFLIETFKKLSGLATEKA